MTEFPTLHTPRLTLGQIEVSDIPSIVKYANNPSISKMLRSVPYPYHEDNAIGWLNRIRTKFEQKKGYTFRISLANENSFIGNIGIGIKKAHQKAMVGYWLAEPFWGKGYMTEAMAAVLKFGFEELHLNKICATFLADNPASGRVMIKNGMVKEAEFVDDEFNNGKFLTIMQYRLTKDEYEKNSD